jgi:hypothetical protein
MARAAPKSLTLCAAAKTLIARQLRLIEKV